MNATAARCAGSCPLSSPLGADGCPLRLRAPRCGYYRNEPTETADGGESLGRLSSAPWARAD